MHVRIYAIERDFQSNKCVHVQINVESDGGRRQSLYRTKKETEKERKKESFRSKLLSRRR